MSELSKILTEANTEKWSLRDIENQAARHGHKLNFTTAGKYLNGTHGKPTAEVLNAFADVFRLDANDLRAAAGLPSSGEPFILPSDAALLTGPEREAIKHLVRVMVESKATRIAGAEIEKRKAAQEATQPTEVDPRTPHQRAEAGIARGKKYVGHRPLPKNFFDLAANDVPSQDIQQHTEHKSLGEESQEHPED